MTPSCCSARLLHSYAAAGIAVTVTDRPPTDPPLEPVLAWRCAHGALWYVEPTAEQAAAWHREAS